MIDDEPEAVVPYPTGGIVKGPLPFIGSHAMDAADAFIPYVTRDLFMRSSLTPQQVQELCCTPGIIEVIPRSLQLTDHHPLIPGFYWLKKGGALTMRQVVNRGGVLMVEQQNVLCSLDVFTGSKWAGPIPEPEEEPYDERETMP